MVDLPDFSDLLKRIAGSTEKIADKSPHESETEPGVWACETGGFAGTDLNMTTGGRVVVLLN